MATIVPDSYDKLFLKCEGEGTNFVDSSTDNPKTITANGNATQLPIKFNKSAGFFNGTTDYVVVPSSTDFNLSGDFTIEFNVMILTRPTNGVHMMILSRYQDANNYFQVSLYNNNSSTDLMPHFFGNLGGVNFNDSSTFGMSANTWYHVAIIRSGSTVYASVNGIVNATGGTTTDKNISMTAPLQIAALNGGSFSNCWIKEVRISNTARWTSSFTPSTTEYASDANTVLLMHFDTPATSPLGPAIAFDGTGDYLDLADSADFAAGTGKFTSECFFKAGNSATLQTLIDQRTGDSTSNGYVLYVESGALKVYSYNSTVISGGSIASNSWNHAAFVGNGGADGARTFKLYLNGIQVGSTWTVNYNFTDQKIRVGAKKSDAGSPFTGFMREIRISNVARYTSAFTPSQTGFTVDSNTKLYIKGNENNGSTTFKDETGKTVVTVGDTKIKYGEDYRSCVFVDSSASAHKVFPMGSAKIDFFSAFGNGVGYFDGTNSTLTTPSTPELNLGSDDFSIEVYVRHSNIADTTQGYVRKLANNGTTGFCFLRNTGNGLLFLINGNEVSASAPDAGGFSLNTWSHLAVTRSGTTYRLFANGILEATATSATEILDNSEVLMIGKGSTIIAESGRWYNEVDYFLVGLLDNIRISKGIARYIQTFNPPEDFVKKGSARKKSSNWFPFYT